MRRALLFLAVFLAFLPCARAEERTATVTAGGETIRYAHPAGYVLATDARYPALMALLREGFKEGMRLDAVYVPDFLDARAEQNPETTMDAYLLVATHTDLDERTFTRREFVAVQEWLLANPDELGGESAPGTSEEIRRVGAPVMADSVVLSGFQALNSEGATVYGVMAMLHVGKGLVYLYLYEMGETDDVVPRLRTAMTRAIGSMHFPPPYRRDPKPFIVVGLGLVAAALVLGLILALRGRRAG